MELLCAYTMIGLGIKVPLVATGGVEPYSYSIISGGGSIDSSGVYTAGNAPGAVLIRATDSTPGTPQTADYSLNVGHAIHLFCDIIRKELMLSSDQVFIYNSKWTIPNDSRLYVAVGILNPRPFANKSKLNSDGEEVQSVNMFAPLSVNVCSRNNEAMFRKEEVIMALKSYYAESQQELNSFYIGKISSNFVSLGELEGAAIPYRYNITVNVQYMMNKKKGVPYFDAFNYSIITNP